MPNFKIKYRTLHKWISKTFEEVLLCEKCDKNKKLEWCSIDHKYTQERKDWLKLCRSCHQKMDGKSFDVKKICGYCGAEFITKKQSKNRIPKYCSKICYAKSLIGHKSTPRQLEALKLGREKR